MNMTPIRNFLWLVLAIAALVALSFAFARLVGMAKAQDYRPDHIDIERHENWKAMRAHNCYWYGTQCGDGWRRHYRSRHHYRQPDPNPEIKWAQLKLKEWGFDVEADGLMGPQTRAAVYALQAKAGIPATGELDERTWEVLTRDHPARGSWMSGPPRICRENRSGEVRHCACDPIPMTSAEHLFKDAKVETMKRWRGAVRSLFGELFASWKHAVDKVEHCWRSGTGERTADNHTRCIRIARPCWGVLVGDDSDDYDDEPLPRKGRVD